MTPGHQELERPVRIGILGAAKIAPTALVVPARDVPGVEIVAIAARDRNRAAAFARAHDIPRVYGGYEALLQSGVLDAVYIALPASEHARWTLAALEHGLHVLLEKPLTSNSSEAAVIVDAAVARGRVLMEAFHWRYHPVADLMIELAGQLGTVHAARARFEIPRLDAANIQWDISLGGGALMDLGCYPVQWLRTALAGEPSVVRARATVVTPEVDGAMEATLVFPTGVQAELYASMLGDRPPEEFASSFEAEGERGFVRVLNPLAPHSGHRVEYEIDGIGNESRTLTLQSTYFFQLEAFRDAVVNGTPPLTGGSDAVANMRVIDEIYRAAGLHPRGEVPV